MIRFSRGQAAAVLGVAVGALVGFGAAAGGLIDLSSWGGLSQTGTILVAAIPALAAYVRTGRVENQASEIKAGVEAVQAQTNGTTTTLVDVTSRAVDALAAIANDPVARQRAAGLLRTIEHALPDQPHPDDPPEPSATVTPGPG